MSDGVVVAWIFPREVSGWFCHCLVDLMQWDIQGPGHLDPRNGGSFIALSSGPRVAEARNMVVDKFASDHPNATWLFMVDADMTFKPDILERLIAVADPIERPIVGALAFAAAGDHGGPFPTIYKEIMLRDEVFVDRVDDYPRDALIKVGATGGAGMLIHRNVLARMSEPWPKGFGTLENGAPNPYPWFSEGLVNQYGKPLGEDIAFCRRASLLGIPVHVHTGIKMGHMKTFELDEDYYLARKRDDALTTGDRAARRRAARSKAKELAQA